VPRSFERLVLVLVVVAEPAREGQDDEWRRGVPATDVGLCEVCPTLTTLEELGAELRRHAGEVAEAATPRAIRRLRVILDRVAPDIGLLALAREVAVTIVSGQQCHPELDDLHDEVCPCRAGGSLHLLDAEETHESLALLVAHARAIYDRRGNRTIP